MSFLGASDGEGLYICVVKKSLTPQKQRKEPIIFTNCDLPAEGDSHKDALVITLNLNGTLVRRVQVDTESSVNVMCHDILVKLGLSEDQLTHIRKPLTCFTGDTKSTL